MRLPGSGATAVGLAVWLGLASVIAHAGRLPLSQTAHDRSFWRRIVESDFAVPAGASAFALIVELNDLLGDPDPELRDGFGFEIPWTWIIRDDHLSPPDGQRASLAARPLTVSASRVVPSSTCSGATNISGRA